MSKEVIDNIIKFGLDDKELDRIKSVEIQDLKSLDLKRLIAHIECLELCNDRLRDSLDEIASGMISPEDVPAKAQRTLESSTIRRWRNNG